MKTSEINTRGTDDPICPHCGHEQSDAWEFTDVVHEHECYACEKTFDIVRNITVTYTTRPSVQASG